MYKLRKAIISDAPVIVSFQVKMAWETEKYKLNFDTVTKGVEAVLHDSNKGTYYVAEYVDISVILTPLIGLFQRTDFRLTISLIFFIS